MKNVTAVFRQQKSVAVERSWIEEQGSNRGGDLINRGRLSSPFTALDNTIVPPCYSLSDGIRRPGDAFVF